MRTRPLTSLTAALVAATLALTLVGPALAQEAEAESPAPAAVEERQAEREEHKAERKAAREERQAERKAERRAARDAARAERVAERKALRALRVELRETWQTERDVARADYRDAIEQARAELETARQAVRAAEGEARDAARAELVELRQRWRGELAELRDAWRTERDQLRDEWRTRRQALRDELAQPSAIDDLFTRAATDALGVVRTELGLAEPDSAPGQRLGLWHYVIPAGQELEPHTHPGWQLARVTDGELEYTVLEGEGQLLRADGASAPMGPGTYLLGTGDGVIESPTLVHAAANRGAEPVTIISASLLAAGEPLSTLVEDRQ